MANKMLGKYELLEELGRGGFGTVYRALDTSLDIERAVKVLHPALASDPEFITRFKREAKFAARVEHPGIVPVYEFGEVEGSYFLAMKYMAGGSLKDLLKKEKRLPFARALEVASQVAAGLDYAHQKSLVHRDIKPGNILFEGDPLMEPGAASRLSDFGFAKALSGAGSVSLSASGSMVGTPSYMAPEIWLGQEISPATDVYSLACVFFEMITGQVLFDGKSPAQVMTRHMLEGPKFPQQWPEGTPEGLQAVLGQALEKDPARRYQSAGVFGTALSHLSMDEQNHRETSPKGVHLPVKAKTPPAAEPAKAVIEDQNKPAVATGSPDKPIAEGILKPPRLPEAGASAASTTSAALSTYASPPRFAEKSMPYLLLLFGLALCSGIFLGMAQTLKFITLSIGILVIIAGIGLFWLKNWARKLGMVFAGLLEAAGIVVVVVLPETGYYNIFLVIGIVAILVAIFFFEILGGKRMVSWTGGRTSQPAGFWAIFTGFATTILGLLPALLMLKHVSKARLWGRIYAFLLSTAIVIIWSSVFNRFTFKTFLIGLCLWAFFTLQSRRFREEYEKGGQK